MKKCLFLMLLLSVVSMAVSAEDYATSDKAAEASHKALKEEIQSGAKKTKPVKILLKGLSKPTLKYDMVSTENKGQANEYDKKNPTKIKIEANKYAFEGNLTIKDTKNGTSKYVAKGYFIISKDSLLEKVKDEKTKKITKRAKVIYQGGPAQFDPEKLTKVFYFENEAQNKANELVKAYYKPFEKSIENLDIQKAVSCEEGYKITTKRILYKDDQHFIGNIGTVIFTIQKAEKLDDFKLLENPEEHLEEFDNTPAPEEPTTPTETETNAVANNNDNDINIEDVVIDAFKFNSISLSDNNKEQLDKAAQILLSNKDMEIELLGHSCDLGAAETNYNIGIMRAKGAKMYLVSKGVEPNRIYVHSCGSKKPLVPNTSAENRAQNRRVEIKIIK